MRNVVPDIIIVTILGGAFLVTYFLVNIFYGFFIDEDDQSRKTVQQIVDTVSKEYSWIVKLTINCIGYSAVLLPGLLIYKYTKKTKYLERSEPSLVYRFVKLCFAEHDKLDTSFPSSAQTRTDKRAVAKECIMLLYCFFGLMGSYLTWGVLQEKIMTREYVGLDGKTKAFFKDSQFLVFANRFLALFIALGYMSFVRQPKQRAPLFKFSYASFSNVMSAWMQYEALKFISFPTQVLAKSCKIIPVMIMGKIISRNKYEFYEYIVAAMISLGMVFFLSGSYNHGKHSPVTTFAGLFLLCMYMVFDSFTSNWQSEIFKSYSISSIQMMAGVNFFSALFTAASLFVQDGFSEGIAFSAEHPKFLIDIVVLSVSSAIGQLFIYYTIEKFGAVAFTIIMTLRQAVAILLSCLIYDHDISPMGVVGIVIVFMGIFIRVYSSHRLKTMRKRHELLRKQLKLNA